MVFGAAAVRSRPDVADEIFLKRVRDSKLMTPKAREDASQIIRAYFPSCVVTRPVSEIDTMGLSEVWERGVAEPINGLIELLEGRGDRVGSIIVDGSVAPSGVRLPVQALIKADNLVKAVSAASVIAKVERDGYMKRLALEYPVYGFEKHMGYGTAQHKQALEEHGLCPEHRRSFSPMKGMVAKELKKVLAAGMAGR
jgi:ribonuclease HII